MRILIVKTSSMGDVVHALPVVHDLRRAFPNIEIEWLVESSFAGIVRMHPGVNRVLPLNWRRWRRKLLDSDTWRAMRALRAQLRERPYDCVLDLQGLFKSAMWGRLAAGPLVGYDSASGRDPIAPWLYVRKAAGGTEALEYVVLHFEDLVITSFNLGGQPQADQIEEVVKLNYAKVHITYTPQDNKGQGMPPVLAGWNLQENVPM